MRQWELIGITDTMPAWTPPRAAGFDTMVQTVVDSSVFFWTTDAGLHLLTVTEAAAEHLGRSPRECEGHHLAELVGGDGAGEVLEAHVAALNGRTSMCCLDVEQGTVCCRVAPTKDANGDVIGTYCLAVSWNVDLSERGPLLAHVA